MPWGSKAPQLQEGPGQRQQQPLLHAGATACLAPHALLTGHSGGADAGSRAGPASITEKGQRGRHSLSRGDAPDCCPPSLTSMVTHQETPLTAGRSDQLSPALLGHLLSPLHPHANPVMPAGGQQVRDPALRRVSLGGGRRLRGARGEERPETWPPSPRPCRQAWASPSAVGCAPPAGPGTQTTADSLRGGLRASGCCLSGERGFVEAPRVGGGLLRTSSVGSGAHCT